MAHIVYVQILGLSQVLLGYVWPSPRWIIIIIDYNVCFTCLQYDITMDLSNVTLISGCGFWRGAPHKFYAFNKWLMGGAPRTFTCIQIREVEMPFTQ